MKRLSQFGRMPYSIEKMLKNQGVDSDANFVSRHVKDDTYKLLEHVRMQKNLNVRIIIGEEKFDCHLIVLKSKSKYFLTAMPETDPSSKRFRVYTLPREKVSMWAFQQLYEWMLTEGIQPPRVRFMELLDAAKYLGIDDYVNMCWEILTNTDLCNEVKVFALYQEARARNMDITAHFCLQQISYFFLPLVASRAFVLMPVGDVVVLLNSYSIYIHSELEVFYSAVRWLQYDWDARKEYTIKVLNCVRFKLLSAKELENLRENRVYLEVFHVLRMPHVLEMIAEARSFIDLKVNAPNEEVFEKQCEQTSIKMPKLRSYLLAQTRAVKHVRSYPSFMEYLQKIRAKPPNFYETIFKEPPREDEVDKEIHTTTEMD